MSIQTRFSCQCLGQVARQGTRTKENADSHVVLKVYKASKLFTSTLGIESANEPEELTTHVLEMFTNTTMQMQAFSSYLSKMKQKLSSMTCATPMWTKDSAIDLKSTLVMIQFQR